MGGMEQGGKQALEGGDICIYTADSLCCIAETNTTIIIKAIICVSCPTLCNPIDHNAHQAPLSMGILQARILEWVNYVPIRKKKKKWIFTHHPLCAKYIIL